MLILRGRHHPTQENTIAIFAMPRSGSTWFSELLNKIPKTIKVDEPLFRGPLSLGGNIPKGQGKLKILDRLNFFYFQPIPPNEEYPKAKAFFDDLLSLKFDIPYLFEETKLLQIPKSENVLMKFCYGNLLLPWLIQQYDFSAIVLLRNPYAVVSSQLKHHSFREILHQDKFCLPKFMYREIYSKYDEITSALKRPEELLTAIWCINYLAVINLHTSAGKVLTVSYEWLISNPSEEMTRIFSFLDKSIPVDVFHEFKTPSKSTLKDDFNPEIQLLSWRNDLDSDQISRIKNVLDKFDIEAYSDASLPIKELLYK